MVKLQINCNNITFFWCRRNHVIDMYLNRIINLHNLIFIPRIIILDFRTVCFTDSNNFICVLKIHCIHNLI